MIMTEYIKIFENYLKKELKYNKPENLYKPVKYLLESGGKRLRPIIALHVSKLLGGQNFRHTSSCSNVRNFSQFHFGT